MLNAVNLLRTQIVAKFCKELNSIILRGKRKRRKVNILLILFGLCLFYLNKNKQIVTVDKNRVFLILQGGIIMESCIRVLVNFYTSFKIKRTRGHSFNYFLGF